MLINGLVLPKDYEESFTWLAEHVQENEVMLASPAVGLWLPAKPRGRVVYGHEFDTIPEAAYLAQVETFYRGDDCSLIYRTDLDFTVSYVVWEPAEDIFREDIGALADQETVPICLSLLQQNIPPTAVKQIDEVTIFRIDDTIRTDLATQPVD